MTSIRYKQATQEDIENVLRLEESLFGNKSGYKPEIREGYEKFLDLGGTIHLQYVDGKINTILASLDVANLNDSILDIPEDSPLRMNYTSGRLNGRNGHWIYEFAGIGAERRFLYKRFRDFSNAFGFVPASNEEAVTEFAKVFSQDGTVPNLYDPEERDVVFTHPKNG